jgi:hypothetical protein
MMNIGYGLINPYVAIVLLIVVLSIILAKMLGKATKNKELEAWSSVETSELAMSILIFLFIFAIYSTLLTVSRAWLVDPIVLGSSIPLESPTGTEGFFDKLFSVNQVTGKSSGSDIQLSLMETVTFKLKFILYNRLMPMLIDLMKTKFTLLLYSGLGGVHRGPGAIGFNTPAIPGIGFFVKGCDTLIFLFTTIAPTISAQVIGLEIIGAISYNLLLPLGILFRFVPFLRKFGNEMIAVSIAMGILLPVAYLLLLKAVDDIETQHNVPGVVRSTDMSEAKWNLMANTAYFGNTYVTIAPLAASMGTTFLLNAADTFGKMALGGKTLRGSAVFTSLSTLSAAFSKTPAFINYPIKTMFHAVFSVQYVFGVFAVMIPAAHLGGFVLVGLMIPSFAFMLSLSFVGALIKVLNVDISDAGVLI